MTQPRRSYSVGEGTPYDQLIASEPDPVMEICRSRGFLVQDPAYRTLLGTCRRRRELLVRALFYLEHPGPHDLERRTRIADIIRREMVE